MSQTVTPTEDLRGMWRVLVGASLGVVLGGLVTSITIRANVGAVLGSLPVESPQRDALTATLTHGSANQVEQALAALGPSSSEALRAALRGVQDDAFDHTMIALAVVAAAGTLLAAWLLRGPVPPPYSAASLVKTRPQRSLSTRGLRKSPDAAVLSARGNPAAPESTRRRHSADHDRANPDRQPSRRQGPARLH